MCWLIKLIKLQASTGISVVCTVSSEMSAATGLKHQLQRHSQNDLL